jgi:hypothetical protein
MQLAQATVCADSNELATNECVAAGSSYDITLPIDKVPNVPCHIHGGVQTQPLAQGLDDAARKAEALPSRIFNSFRKFFGRK